MSGSLVAIATTPKAITSNKQRTSLAPIKTYDPKTLPFVKPSTAGQQKVPISTTFYKIITLIRLAVAERLQHRSCDHKVPSSIPFSGISVVVTSQC